MAEVSSIQGDRSSGLQLDSHRAVLDNGLVILVTENPSADIIAARIFLDAGSRHEQPLLDRAGLSHMAASLLTKGTQTQTAQEIAEQVESIGASLGVSSAPDYFLVSLKTIGSDFADILKLAAGLIRHPIFPESELALERKLTLQAIRARQEQPMAIALEQLRQSIYRHHPYSQNGLGTLETVERLQRSELRQFHARYFRPDTTVLSIAGNITLEKARSLAEELLGDWMPASAAPPAASRLTLDSTPHQRVRVQNTQQSIVMLGYPAPAIRDADYSALKLLYTYLCSGLSSRLFTELREKRGMAYEVSGLFPTRLHPSHFVAYLGTASQNTALALSLLKDELLRLSTQPLSETEVRVAKNKLLGQHALGKQTNHQIAHLYGLYEFLQLGADYDRAFVQSIQAIAPEQLYRAALQHLKEPFVSVVGPETGISSLASL
ncbi:M16 family metallopeptidase [Altericista sp. CCNU0014]|uniref:M16 family metallopeptidase n=1 Tax=Altericista sp. CCNU0014 TaxID=3082949 RepID=UPI0038507915